MASANAERQRRYRERQKQQGASNGPILFTSEDWSLFTQRHTLPQKAGCQPSQIGRVILKELVDNALDAGADRVTITGDEHRCVVTDDGPGVEDVARLFAVNRPMISSKQHMRLPTRGMLGNGLRAVMGAVAAYTGTIAVTTRGRRLDLAVDVATGHTTVIGDTPAIGIAGTRVELSFPKHMFNENDYSWPREAISLAKHGQVYSGPSVPSWYSPTALRKAFHDADGRMSVGELVSHLFGITIDDPRPGASLTEEDTKALLDTLPSRLMKIGSLGAAFYSPRQYHLVNAVANIDGAEIPFCVEAWVSCKHAKKGEKTRGHLFPIINRSHALAYLTTSANSVGLHVDGCGLDLNIPSAKFGHYNIALSLITPYLRKSGDGKAPVLSDFAGAIEKALQRAASNAYRDMIRPPTAMTLVDAAYQVMEAAYLKASDDGKLPAKARQIMYAARPDILRLTGRDKFSDKDFTQKWLPNYLAEHPKETADWNVVYDARGHLKEPHTGLSVPLGTLQVRRYVGEPTVLGEAVELNASDSFPTHGPVNRYENVLFIEKEGFDELFEAVKLAERYDLAIMSTKGVSVTAARLLLDKIMPQINKVFVLHDLDISGFSILGTLGTTSRRYAFTNKINIVDLGLRLGDAEEMGLDPETVEVKAKAKERYARRGTLKRHGATAKEIEFLCPEVDDDDDEAVVSDCQRIELNAMTSRELVDFIEEKLEEHGVKKLVPDEETLIEHAKRLKEQAIAQRVLDRLGPYIKRKAEAATADLPDDLTQMVEEALTDDPKKPWDEALAGLID
jgi:hypothetical protein